MCLNPPTPRRYLPSIVFGGAGSNLITHVINEVGRQEVTALMHRHTHIADAQAHVGPILQPRPSACTRTGGAHKQQRISRERVRGATRERTWYSNSYE